MPNKKNPSSGSKCPSCQTPLHAEAEFCYKCGSPAGVPRAAKRLDWKGLTPVAALIVATVALMLVVGKFATERKDEPSSPPSNAVAPSGQAIDLSKMTPRDAADRLFNRVMAADERGDKATATQFAPMALQAYQLVERPDTDVHYHMGLINLVLGNLDAVRGQIENVKRDSADHLLGLALAYTVAKRSGDDKAEADILARFAAAYDAEIKRGKPEYEAHRNVIDRLRLSATGSSTAGIAGR